jgi:hypothetical protein
MIEEPNSVNEDVEDKISTQDQELDEQELSSIAGGTHTITSPRDPASGLPTGKRQHKPFTFLADLDE